MKNILFFIFKPSPGIGWPTSSLLFPASAQLPLPFPPSGLLHMARSALQPLRPASRKRPACSAAQPTSAARIGTVAWNACARPLSFFLHSLRGWPTYQRPCFPFLSSSPCFLSSPALSFSSRRRWRGHARQAASAPAPVWMATKSPQRAPLPFLVRRSPPANKNPSRAPVFSLSRPLEARITAAVAPPFRCLEPRRRRDPELRLVSPRP